jgi:hypothetical protein
MSIQSTVDRIDAIRQALANPAAMITVRNPLTGGAEAPAATATAGNSTGTSSPFANALTAASASYEPAQGVAGLTGSFTPGSGGAGSRIVAAAESQLGQTEMPPGSNESPAIAMYREATAGAAPGEPWCAYFASWASRQAGEPIGPAGEGLGSVGAIWSWAQSSGRAIANGPGVVPQPGDLIVFGDEHVGIVRGVLPDGRIETIEGNFENKVAANVRGASEATGYVSMT